jgi:hypothetical protein
MTHVRNVLNQAGLLQTSQPPASPSSSSSAGLYLRFTNRCCNSQIHLPTLDLTPNKPLPSLVLDTDLRNQAVHYRKVTKAQPLVEHGKVVKKTRGGRVVVSRERKEVLKLCKSLLRQHLKDTQTFAFCSVLCSVVLLCCIPFSFPFLSRFVLFFFFFEPLDCTPFLFPETGSMISLPKPSWPWRKISKMRFPRLDLQ